jgi:hypothetical protein
MKNHKTFQNFAVISHLNNTFQELYLPNQENSTDESQMLWKGFQTVHPTQGTPNMELKFTSCVMLPLGTCGPFLYI